MNTTTENNNTTHEDQGFVFRKINDDEWGVYGPMGHDGKTVTVRKANGKTEKIAIKTWGYGECDDDMGMYYIDRDSMESTCQKCGKEVKGGYKYCYKHK